MKRFSFLPVRGTMNRCSAAVLCAAFFFAVLPSSATDLPAVTPVLMPDFPSCPAIWINGGSSVRSSFGKEKVADSFSGTILRKLSTKPETGVFSATYVFSVAQEGLYDFFAALTTQKQPYTSPVDFRFDSGPWGEVPASSRDVVWGISNAVSWHSLGRRKMTAGKHTLEFRITRRSALGTWSFMCDGIAGFRSGQTGRIWNAQLCSPFAPGKKLSVGFRYEGRPFPGTVRLTFAGESVVSLGTLFRPGENRVELEIPGILPRGDYRVDFLPLGAAGDTQSIPAAYAPPVRRRLPPRLLSVRLQKDRYALRFSGGEAHPVLALLFVQGKMYAASLLSSSEGVLPEGIVKFAKGRRTEIRFQPVPAVSGNWIVRQLELPGVPAALPKPVNYGVFSDCDKIAHFWYMNHAYEYIFDGRRYFPVGGMWCPDTLNSRDSEIRGIAARLERDRKIIRAIRKAGLDDVYLNLSSNAPLWVRQKFIDMLEEEGIHYGYQLAGGGGGVVPAFFITRDDPGAKGNYRALSRGVYSGGRVTAQFPLEQKLAGLLVVDPANPEKGGELIAFSDIVGRDLRSGIIDLEKAQDFGKLRRIVFPVGGKYREGGQVILIPFLEAKVHHVDLWNPEVFRKWKNRVSWIGAIRWGKHLRAFIDPIANETNMVNGTENLRQFTPGFNKAFGGYLKRRYGSLEKLKKEWGADLKSFEEASRLIPLRLEDTLWLADPATGRVVRGELDSFFWIDYQEALRETYADLADQAAGYLKSLVNVPVVFKSVGVIGEKMSISRGYLGADGVGFETYLNQGIHPGEAAGGAARAEAEASSHTVWKVGTEIGNSAEVGNGGVKFFRSESELRTMARKLLRLGVSGFYFFGFDLKPGNLWNNHNYHDFPEGLAWAAGIERDFVSPGVPPVVPTPANYVFPGGFSWWWWTTRYKALFGYEQNLIPLSARLGKESPAWFSSTNVLPAEFDAVLINCPRPPFSRYYAKEIGRAVASGKTVYYVGFRSDPGAIPELDRFFTSDWIAFADGSRAQVLRPVGGARVLAAGKGKAWALRAGNLIIVSRIPDELPRNNADSFLRYLTEIVSAEKP